MKKLHQIKAVLAGLLLSSSVIPVVMADDTEIYTTSSASTATNPNILFVVDASSDMLATSVVPAPYNPATEYEGDCSSDYVYFSQDGSLPECTPNSTGFFNKTALVCENSLKTEQYVLDGDGESVLDDSGSPTIEVVDGPLLTQGRYADRIAQNAPVGNGGDAIPGWRAISVTQNAQRSYIVECMSDSGVHGETDDSASKYIEDGDAKYTGTEGVHSLWQESSSVATLFHPNYINYRNTVAQVADTELSYIDQIKNAVRGLVETNTGVNIGLMVLDQDGTAAGDPGSEGGGIMYEVQDGSLPRGNFIPQLLAVNASGSTPLAEAYYEALLYYGGKAVDYGTAANPPLVGSATDAGNNNYISPIQLSCQKNYIVLTSNGKATHDDINETRQGALDGFNIGSCSDTITPTDISDDNQNAANSSGSTNDNCLDELAEWAQNNDVATLADNDAHTGEQVITTHTIGFGYADAGELDPDQLAGQQLLQDTATGEEGRFYKADTGEALQAAFEDIVFNAKKVNSTFSSPAVSVNAFNRSTHLNDLYFTLFKPANGNHWEGNLKKYKLEFAVDSADIDGDGDTTEKLPFIADQNHAAAVDPGTGFFSEDAKSYWSTELDGKEVALGGAASRFTTTRNVYTFTGSYDGLAPSAGSGDLTDSANRVKMSNPDNAALTVELLDIVDKAEIVAGTPYRETLINWASGLDALSNFGTVADFYEDVRPQMGDPLHAEPALVQYGKKNVTVDGATVEVDDLVSYTATNDGYLHAIDVDNGNELFSFIPQELLPKLQIAMEDTGGEKLYGLDGSVVAWINDADGDGTIEIDDNEHVYIYVTMRRGGRNIYALDVTTKTAPKLLWVIKGGEGDYTELGQTWSTVNVEKIKDGATEKTVLMFGGGYDVTQDAAAVTTADGVGRTVYIADATTGARLWTASQNGDSSVVTMDYSVPARVKPLDISGDGFIDRVYASDMGGQVFRFDIDNTNDAALASSITGGRIADLADASTAADSRTAANARRFYYPPDVALINATDGKYHGLVVSSGYRAHPLNDDIHDRIYMIKDRNTGLLTSNSDYKYKPGLDSVGSLTETDLHDATLNTAGNEGITDVVRSAELANITGAEGWYIKLIDESTSTWVGEKGLAEALIIEGVAIVTTYTPNLTVSTTSCDPNIGTGRVYFLDMLDATAAFPSSLDTRGDRHIDLARGGIPPSPNVIITEEGVPTLCIGTECKKADLGLGVRKTYWYEVN